MDFSALNPVAIILAIVVASTPLVFAAIGELVVEKSGVLNLGVEGLMIVGAVCGFAAIAETGSYFVAIPSAMIGGAVMGLLFGVLTQILLANQVATGLALTMFGLGVAALAGQKYSGQSAPDFPKLDVPVLSDLPVVGPLLFGHDYLVYVSIALIFAVSWFLRKTRTGLIVRAVGENHEAAHAIGYAVTKIRILALMFGGACAGLGGAYLSIVQTPLWVENMTAGRGWIALAIVVFASWKSWRCLLGAYLFGGVTILQFNAQAVGVDILSQYLSMLPYLATILVLVIISADKAKAKLNAPACLGKTFFAAS